jgi:hypothetical protein
LEGTVTVEVNDMTVDEEMAVEQLGHLEEAPLGTAGTPKRLADGTKYRVTTTAGTKVLVGSRVSVWSGGEGVHLMLHMDAPGIADSPVLAVPVDGPELGPLRVAKTDPKLVAKVLPRLQRKLASIGSAAVKSLRLEADHVTAIPGAFPSPHVALVSVDAWSEGIDNTERLSGMFFVNADGEITTEVYSLDVRLDEFPAAYLVDIGEDGVDEVVYHSRYYEGEYVHLLRWKKTAPATIVLGGDGA